MPNPVPANRQSFEENINSLLEELVLAEKWQRPSILLAVHKSKFGQNKAQQALEDRLNKLGQNVTHLLVDQDRSDIPHFIVGTPSPDKSVFFVSNVDWGGGADRKDAYRALNIYRELFVEHHIKIVLWLTVNEAANLPRFAPDFWAFRHRVIEFTGQRLPRKINLPAGVLIWDVQNPVDSFDKLEARVSVREELLAKLPHNTEALSARIDLLNNLGYLYWARGDSDKASEELAAGLDLAGEQLAGKTRSSLLNGLAIISYEAEKYDRAIEIYEKALQDNPADPSLLINLSATCRAVGRNLEAISLAKRALKIDARDPKIWNALGFIYAAMGKFDEAITCFGKAAELAPRNAAYPIALAICYDLVERPDETGRQLKIARKLAKDQTRIYLDIYEAALLGNTAKSLELAHAAIFSNQISKYDLRRDPNLNLLMDSVQIQEMFA